MTTPLDVLLIESHPGSGDADADQLAAVGHRIHRCFPTPHEQHGTRVALRDRYLCTAVTTGSCPLDVGIDVALLVRHRIATRPAASEAAVSCALRAGVPVVEHGPDLLDPYEPWLSGRVTDDTAAACEAAAAESFDSLGDEIRRRIAPVVAASGIDVGALSCRFEPAGPRLRVVLTGPPTTRSVRQALAARVLDAVRAGKRTFGQVDVSYEASPT
jgi:hypothetical protein